MKDNVNRENNFKTLLNQTKTETEKEGLSKLFMMLISIRQQILLRKSMEKENKYSCQKEEYKCCKKPGTHEYGFYYECKTCGKQIETK